MRDQSLLNFLLIGENYDGANGEYRNNAPMIGSMARTRFYLINSRLKNFKPSEDFYNWIKDVFRDVELAKKIAGVGDKKHLQLVIYRHMAGHKE